MSTKDRGHAPGCKSKRGGRGGRLEYIDVSGVLLRAYVCEVCHRVSFDTALQVGSENIRYVPINEVLAIADKLREYKEQNKIPDEPQRSVEEQG